MSVLVKSGTYSAPTETIITPEQQVDIVGDIGKTDEPVVLKCRGAASSPACVHLLSVFGGDLKVTGVELRQESFHLDKYGIYIDRGIVDTNIRCLVHLLVHA